MQPRELTFAFPVDIVVTDKYDGVVAPMPAQTFAVPDGLAIKVRPEDMRTKTTQDEWAPFPIIELPAWRQWKTPSPKRELATGLQLRRSERHCARPRERRTTRRVAAGTRAGPSSSSDDSDPSDLEKLQGFRAAFSRMYARVARRLLAEPAAA
jgi:hypothetical protein